mmetsp:Transcript_12973/g.11100  ORF Transcript_12973/g.11100 Transcript_12973/m.11100 type:complete len:102 (-) Transcript_12973:775-1080(-)
MLQGTTKSYNSNYYSGFVDTMTKIYRNEGFHGLYKGYNVTAVAIPLFHSLYFSIFYGMKEYLNKSYFEDKHPLINNVIAAVGTGFICHTVTNPFWIVRTRI